MAVHELLSTAGAWRRRGGSTRTRIIIPQPRCGHFDNARSEGVGLRGSAAPRRALVRQARSFLRFIKDRLARGVLKNQVLVGTVNAAPEDSESAVRALSQFQSKWPGAPERLKTHAVEPGQVQEALHNRTGIKQYVRF